MAEQYFDRYGVYRVDGEVKPVPYIKIKPKASDIVIVTKETTRFDIISDKYYGNGKHGWLILHANPSFGGLEFDIPVGTKIRIPFPFLQSLQELEDNIRTHINLYGI
tara:strand:- start:263 stop:583 length:321 start_codon:yes stop_codon:yes gene_type:complete